MAQSPYKIQREKLEELVEKIKGMFRKDEWFRIKIKEDAKTFSINFSTLYFSAKDILEIKHLLTKEQWESITIYAMNTDANIQITERKVPFRPALNEQN